MANARVTTKVKVGNLIAALEAKRQEIVEANAQVEFDRLAELEDLGLRQRNALEDAITASTEGKRIVLKCYSRDTVEEDEYQLVLPEATYRAKQDVSKFDNALAVLRLADPDDDQLIPHDGDYARLLR